MRSELRKWVKHFNARGHAGRGHTTNDTQQMVEKAILLDWARVLKWRCGIHASEITMNANDPPDAFAQVDGVRCSVEVTEIVKGELVADLKWVNKNRGPDDPRVTSRRGDFFDKAQWNRDEFLEALMERIRAKQAKSEKWQEPLDYLVIFTAEDWLLPGDVSEWTRQLGDLGAQSIRHIHLLMDYDPKDPDGYPLFVLR